MKSARLLLCSFAVAASAWQAAEPAGLTDLYGRLQEAPLEYVGQIRNKELSVDRFEFTFDAGELYMLEPVAGHVTGAVFLGDGHVRLEPPDAVERHNVEKLTDEQVFEDRFERAIFRFTDDTGERLRSLAERGGRGNVGKATDRYRDRHKDVFEQRLFNLDGRVAFDLIEPERDGGFFIAQIDGKDHDWFEMEIDPLNEEEARAFKYDHRRIVWDTWAAFHRSADYRANPVQEQRLVPPPVYSEWVDDGELLPARPLSPAIESWSRRVAVPEVHIDLAIDNDGDAKATAGLQFQALRRLAAVRLRISPLLEVTDVRWSAGPALQSPDATDGEQERDAPVSPSGESLPFVQEQHSRRMQENRFEPIFTVALPRAVEAGEYFSLQIAYAGKLAERLNRGELLIRSSLGWYPRHSDARRSTFDMMFRVSDNRRAVSGGRLIDETVEDGTRIARWRVDTPVRAMSFNYGDFEISEVDLDDLSDPTIQVAGLPEITIYSAENSVGFGSGGRQRTIDDLVKSLALYQKYFGPFPYPTLQVTETPSFGGQSFSSFLLLSFRLFGGMHTGEAELFRSHETAHQWWGNDIVWESYRDQWLSEGFAQYAAALYVLLGLENEEQFDDMMSAWQYDVLARVDVAQGLGMKHYGFVPGIIRESDGNESGALVLGVRLNSTETPFDYRLLVYEKGAYVLHMLRMMLLDLDTDSDDVFREMMGDFAERYSGRTASTADFEAAVDATFGQPMDWFFEQWVYGTEVPRYRPDLEVVATPDGEAPFALRGTIVQEDVSDGFRMPLPIRFEYEDGEHIVRRVWIEGDVTSVDIPLPGRPREFVLNHRFGVLARID